MSDWIQAYSTIGLFQIAPWERKGYDFCWYVKLQPTYLAWIPWHGIQGNSVFSCKNARPEYRAACRDRVVSSLKFIEVTADVFETRLFVKRQQALLLMLFRGRRFIEPFLYVLQIVVQTSKTLETLTSPSWISSIVICVVVRMPGIWFIYKGVTRKGSTW